MKAWIAAYVAAVLAMGVLDALWLGWLARDFYRGELGDLMAPQVRLLPAALFYLGYPAGLVALAVLPGEALVATLWRAALVGLVAYGTYDLTNLATLRGWSVRLVWVDIAWGVAASAVGGAAAWRAMAWLRA